MEIQQEEMVQPLLFPQEQAGQPAPAGAPWVRRSTRPTRPPDMFVPGIDFVLLTDCGEPSCFKHTMRRDDHLKWERAMQSEMASLKKNATWDLVSLPTGMKVLPCKWVYKLKVAPTYASPKYKARLVAKGFK